MPQSFVLALIDLCDLLVVIESRRGCSQFRKNVLSTCVEDYVVDYRSGIMICASIGECVLFSLT